MLFTLILQHGFPLRLLPLQNFQKIKKSDLNFEIISLNCTGRFSRKSKSLGRSPSSKLQFSSLYTVHFAAEVQLSYYYENLNHQSSKIPSFAIPRILTMMSGRVFKCGRVSKFMTRRLESQVHEVLIKSKTSEFELLNLRMKSWI